MTLSAGSDTTDLIAAHARRVRRAVPEVAAEIVDAVSERVPRYARPAPTARSALAEAATTALHRFLDALDGAPHRDRGVEDMFRALGRHEAHAGRTLVDFHAALSVGTRVGWRRFQAFGEDEATPVVVSDGLFAFIDRLAQMAEAGHAEALRIRATDPHRARAALAERLLKGAVPEGADEVWPLPETVVVAVADVAGQRPELSALARTALMVGHDDTVVVIADADDRDEVVDALTAAGVRRVAFSWWVEPAAIASAFRWTRRALELVEHGVIAEQPVVDCEQFRTQIWLHSEPALRQRMCQDLLKPLLAETPNSREILSETLLVWLQTRDSAPAIAAQLGVHPQTVRYRWKRINELFGEDLHDPEFIIQITMLLKASVPLWKAGDQSDFERFRVAQEVS